jgi:hypothetical protein
MLQYELGHLSTTSRAAWSCRSRGARRTNWSIPATNGCSCARAAGAHEPDRRARPCAQPRARTRNFRYYISQVYVWAESYLIAAAFTTLTFLVRLLVLVLTLPLILMAAFVG